MVCVSVSRLTLVLSENRCCCEQGRFRLVTGVNGTSVGLNYKRTNNNKVKTRNNKTGKN